MPDTTKHDAPSRFPRQDTPAQTRKPDPVALERLLDGWMDGDEAEQRETFEVLRRCLDEDRPEGYKLFHDRSAGRRSTRNDHKPANLF
jgi:hypothetical protein